jgi:hypothetical protein
MMKQATSNGERTQGPKKSPKKSPKKRAKAKAPTNRMAPVLSGAPNETKKSAMLEVPAPHLDIAEFPILAGKACLGRVGRG